MNTRLKLQAKLWLSRGGCWAERFRNCDFSGSALYSASSLIVRRSYSANKSDQNGASVEDIRKTVDYLKTVFNIAPVTKNSSPVLEERSAKEKMTGNAKAMAADLSERSSLELFRSNTKFENKKLKSHFRTNTLYWYCMNLSFSKSDFERIVPPVNSNISFELVRSRNPRNLTKWLGYYLIFKTPDEAETYRKVTAGAELCGIELKLQSAGPKALGLHSPLLDKVPGVTRQMCALILGLPQDYSKKLLRSILWNYDLVDDDDLNIEFLPKDLIKYGGQPALIRFKNEDDPHAFVRRWDSKIFPQTGNEVFIEVLD